MSCDVVPDTPKTTIIFIFMFIPEVNQEVDGETSESDFV